jgi:hypothetical protein
VKRAALMALALLWAAPARADDMAMVAGRFYALYAALPHMGGIPDATARARYAPLLSPRLGGLINQAAAAEIRFAQKNRNAPPLIEGDLFSSMFEGATVYQLGACGGDANNGQCAVTLTHQQAGQKPVTWNDMLILVNTPSGWKVDDIAYKAGFAFGNTGRLSDMLKMAIAEAPS